MKNNDLRTLTRLALLVAIELVMKMVGLGSVPVGPLYMSFLTLPIAVGAITMGPAVGAGKESPSHGFAVPALFRQGGRGDGGTDCHDQFANWSRNAVPVYAGPCAAGATGRCWWICSWAWKTIPGK